MVLEKGVNCGFVRTAPTADPNGTGQTGINTRAIAFKDIVPTGMVKVTEIGWWCDTPTEEAESYVGIYDHDAVNNRPLNLLGFATFAKGTTLGWKKASVNIDIVEGETYWIASQLDNTSIGTKIDTTPFTGERRDYKNDQGTLPLSWGLSSGTGAYLISVYAVVEAPGPTEGFLDIIGIDIPNSAHVGEIVNLIVDTQNTGATDNFKVELSGDFISSVEFPLDAGMTADVPFSFIMPDQNVSITISTFHFEEEKEGWVWDVNSTWDVNKWF